MIVYAVTRHSRFAYGTREVNEIEKVFETEEQAWSWIEYRYYNTMDLDRVRGAILFNNPLRRDDGFCVYGETYFAEFRINFENFSEIFKICKIPYVKKGLF